MAENIARQKQYDYHQVSSNVIETKRTHFVDEPKGTPESLAGRITKDSFGTRIARDTFDEKVISEKRRLHKEEQEHRQKRAKRSGNVSFLDTFNELESGAYVPRTTQTREAFEHMLTFVQQFLDGMPQDIVRGATDEILSILKDDKLRDHDRKTQVEALLGTGATLSTDRFSQLLNLGRAITDFGSDTGNVVSATTADVGVSVLFDADDDEAAANAEAASGQSALSYEALDDDHLDQDEGDELAMDQQIRASDLIPSGEGGPGAGTASVMAAPAGAGAGSSQARLQPHQVGAQWLQAQLQPFFPDEQTRFNSANEILDILEEATSLRDSESGLVDFFGPNEKVFPLIRLLTRNRNVVLYCTRFHQAQNPADRQALEARMRQDPSLQPILAQLLDPSLRASDAPAAGGSGGAPRPAAGGSQAADAGPDSQFTGPDGRPLTVIPRSNIDLESLAFTQGGHLMSNTKVTLPEGTTRTPHRGYEEVLVPYSQPAPLAAGEELVPISSLPAWAKDAFPSATSLNRVQSRVFPCAFQSDENMLICAPTGAGKTNVAMLTALRAISHFREADGSLRLGDFKIVYIAPMKALVQEMVGNFRSRLAYLGVNVAELTGDAQLTKAQIAETQIIVTTPEKWDIITRKANDRSYTNLVSLIIIDEVHLLHDDRGPVLESVISRTIRHIEQTREPVRLVALSATLPNYRDVAAFMRVDPARGLYYFDSSFRPCPLQMSFIGITEKRALRRFQVSNDITYEKTLDFCRKQQQVIVFVHSRNDTAKTAKMVADLALERETLGHFVAEDAGSREILRTEARNATSPDLQALLPLGFGIHHAGLTREDRTLVEDLFAGGHIRVLVSTATLAWGVNLPAHAVIIKGTQVYNPEKGAWVELSPQDVMQMVGRAGRPQYDTFGEGILITTHNELQYYLSLLNQQLPIESQFISRLTDNLNAEIVLGTVTNRADAVRWLEYTYLHVRMLHSPGTYQVPAEELARDPTLLQRRTDLIHAAASALDRHQLVRYDRQSGRLQATELGRIASHYYITHGTMVAFSNHLRPTMTEIELLRVFSLAEEFKYISVRSEEKLELQKLLENVPIPVRESVDEPSAKVNVLLQSYISRLRLDGFALLSDMVYITQSAGRLARAMHEICLERRWASMTEKTLDFCKIVDKRCWLSMSPLRQFPHLPAATVASLETKGLSFDRLADLSYIELGELVRQSYLGKTLYQAIHQVPKLLLAIDVLPLSRSLLRMSLTITPDFEFTERVHGAAETFLVLVQDVDQETILYHDTFVLKARYSQEDHYMDFTVPVFEPLAPNYFVKIISERWLTAPTTRPVSLKNMILPEQFPPHTELHDLQPQLVSALGRPEFVRIYQGAIKYFNPVQTQCFPVLFNSNENALVCARTGSGKTLCAELAMLRLWQQQAPGARSRVVYMTPRAEALEELATEWRGKFAELNKHVVVLTGESSADLKLLEVGDIVLTVPSHWDVLSRRWMRRRNVQSVDLFIADELHLLGSDSLGPTIEVVLSRLNLIRSRTEHPVRLVGLSYPLANARDVAAWLHVKPFAVFNFHPSVRPVPLEISIQGFGISHHQSLMLAMAKPTFRAIAAQGGKPAIVFTASRRQARLTALELQGLAEAAGDRTAFLHVPPAEIERFLPVFAGDATLQELLPCGIAYYHEAMSSLERRTVETLFAAGAIQVVVATAATCWGMPRGMVSSLVVLHGTQAFDGREHRYVTYPLADIHQMLGRACRPLEDDAAYALVLCPAASRDYLKKFLFEALPVESHLPHRLHDHINAEVCADVIGCFQDALDYFTWTYFFQRLTRNPNYYSLEGVDSDHINEYLSKLAEDTLVDLSESKCIEIEEDSVAPLNLGRIAAFYNIQYTTIEYFARSLTARIRQRGLLSILSAASEFSDLPMRHREDLLLERLHDRVKLKLPADRAFNDPHTKAFLLLQAHFSRFALPADLEADRKLVVGRALVLLRACIDVISSNSWLTPALAAMDISQMLVQAQWDTEPMLRQVPHFGPDLLAKAQSLGVATVHDIQGLEDEDRDQLLAGLTNRQLEEVAAYCNRYPDVDISYEVATPAEEITTSDEVEVSIQLVRDPDEELAEDEEPEEVGDVIAPYYPHPKDESWWVVIGDLASNTLFEIKRVTLQKSLDLSLSFVPPTAGKHTYNIYLISDSYLGCDGQGSIDLVVAQGEEEDEDEEMRDAGDDEGADMQQLPDRGN
ncbi:hypothetical protein H696_04341 [Fonticula alba]|uniref:Pre-mRNA-splicing helicase BRR2 n=1 Tax=Fonticula alba TaxID=691883 RepID=A0A058Z466_FONAL|nr:hypothetical protein H696_04341 [Fonticula alba]KCV68921.1 hypothetical protein H696_04341 [Fonticula alba]|eukprot:XP_009496492.1 hypothetical protein H696_04341 [Fonticula alba]